jgi:low affinity Fe/Cu permease
LILYRMLVKWGWVSVWGFFGALFTFVGVWNLVVRILYSKSEDE